MNFAHLRNGLNLGRLGLGLALLLVALPLGATSVIPPSFSELVDRATQIARVKVTGISSRWDDRPGGRVINTYVKCESIETLKGAAAPVFTLRLLGGTVDDFSMQVAEMPAFEIGGVYVLFVAENGVAFCPLVGMMHGSYRVVRDASTQAEYIVRGNRAPLRSVDDVSLPLVQSAIPGTAGSGSVVTRDAFEQAIVKELNRAGK